MTASPSDVPTDAEMDRAYAQWERLSEADAFALAVLANRPRLPVMKVEPKEWTDDPRD